MKDAEVDAVDRKILSALQQDSRRPIAELAHLAGASTASVQRRLRRLRDSGVILGEAAQLDPARLGFGITAVEVMAMRVPLVLTPIAAHRELDPCAPLAGQLDLRARPSPAEARRRWRRLHPEALVDRRAAAVARHGWDQVAERFDDAYATLAAP